MKPLNGAGGNLCGRTEHPNETFGHGALTKARLVKHSDIMNYCRREANLFAGVHLGNAESLSLPDPFTSDAAPRSLAHSSLSTHSPHSLTHSLRVTSNQHGGQGDFGIALVALLTLLSKRVRVSPARSRAWRQCEPDAAVPCGLGRFF